MASAGSAASRVNSQLNPEMLAHTVNQFQAETSKMQMKDEMLNEAFDDLFADSDEEAESDAIMNQVLEEIGVDIKNALPASKPQISIPAASREKESTSSSDLMEKLNKLRAV